MAGYLLSERDMGRVSRVVRRVEGQVDSLGTTGGDSRLMIPQPVSITFYNPTSETIPAGGIMAITGAALADKIPYLTISKPSATFVRSYAVNGDLPVEKEKFGQCYTSGWVRFAYDTGTPANGDCYGAKPSQWTASANYPAILDCFGILDSTDKIALGYLHPIDHIIGKLAGALGEGNYATVNVWCGAGNSEAVITSMTVTAYDWLMKSGATDIASGKKVVVDWINGVPYVTEAECP